MVKAQINQSNWPGNQLHDFATGSLIQSFWLNQTQAADDSGTNPSENVPTIGSANPLNPVLTTKNWFTVFTVNGVKQDGTDIQNDTSEYLPALNWLDASSSLRYAYRKMKQIGNEIKGIYGEPYIYRFSAAPIANGSDFDDHTKVLGVKYYHSVLSNSLADDYGAFSRTVKIYQKAVSVLKLNGVLVNTTNFPGNEYAVALNTSIVFDKSLSRGKSVASGYSISKFSGGLPVPAVINVDYQIITGTTENTIDTDILQIEFLLSGVYQVKTIIEGNKDTGLVQIGQGPQVTVNRASQILMITAGTSISDEVTLPFIHPVLTPTNNPLNTIQTEVPLVVFSPFDIQCSPVLDISEAEWVRTENNVASDLGATMTSPQWLSVLEQFCKVQCILKDSTGQILQTKDCSNTLGYSHVFSLNIGEYEIGYVVTPL